MKKLFTFLILILVSSGVWGQPWTENFDTETSGTYGTGTITINGRDWTRSDAGNFSYANTNMGSYAFTINDDKVGANITTPVLNSCGTISFKYAFINGNSTNVFVLQKSTDGTNYSDLDTHTLGDAANLSYVDYSFDVNDASGNVYIRILSDNQNAHLFIEDFSVTAYSAGGVDNPSGFSASAGSSTDIDLSWTLNGNSDNVMVAYNTVDTFGDPSGGYSVGEPIGGGGTVIYNSSGVGYNHSGLNSNTTYYYKAWSVDGTTTYSAGTTTSATTAKVEPSNHATSFTAVANGSFQIDLSWTDASSGTTPDGYLVLANKTGTFTDPVDGTEQADAIDANGGIKNIAQGVGSFSWSGLDANTQYFFKIWPYTNSGSHIDYKTDGTVPTDNVTTDAFNGLYIEENFDYSGELTSNGWTAHSGAGTNPISTTTGLSYAGYASSGVGNAANVNNTGEDISKEFTAVTSGTLYLSFLVTVNSATEGYFIHFNEYPASFTYRGRVFVTSDGTGDFEFGLSYAGGAPDDTTNNDYSFGTTYLVVLKYAFVDGVDNDTVELFVFASGVPATEPGTPTIAALTASGNEPTNVGSVSLRQYSSSQDFVVDGIRVADSWDQAPLPVELTSFTAIANGNAVNLKWKTATEVDNYGFEIERHPASSNGDYAATTWQKIAFVEGAGNSNSPKEYSYTDASVVSGKYTYRLKQVDIDGQFQYSNEVEAEIAAPAKYALAQNYPNPFNPTTVISYQIPENGMVELTVYDVLGNEVTNLVNETQEAGKYQVTFNASNLASGIYFYKLSAGNFSSIKKLMLLK